jgi:hypothetical protein
MLHKASRAGTPHQRRAGRQQHPIAPETLEPIGGCWTAAAGQKLLRPTNTAEMQHWAFNNWVR